jgi:hypothetical protein
MRRLGAILGLALVLAPAAQAADQPQVAIDQDGDATFAWRINDSRNNQVQARQFLTGTFLNFLGDTQYLSTPGRNTSEPQVAVDGAGNAIFVWTRFNGTIDVIQTRTMRPDGSLTGVQTLSSTGQATLGSGSPQVAVDPTTGNATFVWRHSTIGNGFGSSFIQARTRAANGTLGPVHTLSSQCCGSTPPQGGPFASKPQVGVDLNGSAVFTWTATENDPVPSGRTIIRARRLNADGTLSPLQTVSDPTRDAKDPQVAVDGNGGAALIWLGFDGADWLVQRRNLSVTGTLSTIQILSAVGSESKDPQLAIAPNFHVAFVWSRQVLSGKFTVQARTTGPAGLTPTQSLSAGGENGLTPQVAIDTDADAVFTWTRNSIVQVRRRAFFGGTLSAIQDLSTAGGNGLDPQIAMTGAEDAVIVWRRATRAGSIIQARTRSATGGLGPIMDLSK